MTQVRHHPISVEPAHDARALRPWGAGRTLVLSIISFGLLPLLAWRRQWARQLDAEQQLIQNSVNSLIRFASPADGAELRRSVEDASIQWLGGLVISMCGMAIGCFFLLWLGHESFTPGHLLAGTYHFDPWRSSLFPWEQNLFLVWTLGLSVAYAAHWASLQWRVSRLQKLTIKVNRLLEARARPPIALPHIGCGFSPRWIIAAGVMVLLGGYWGIFTMMAAGAQRQYGRRTSPQWQAGLSAARTRLAQPPAAALCSNPYCQKALPTDAAFCPRCGTKT